MKKPETTKVNSKSKGMELLSANTGAKRITDRFVKYPYPSNVTSNYQKDFVKQKPDNRGRTPHKQAFNLEKEPKTQTKHKFNANTSHMTDFKPPLKINCDASALGPADYKSKLSMRQKELAGAPSMV